jgi:hypothetical protein
MALALDPTNSKTIVLQFEKEVRIIEGLANEAQLSGIHSRRAHINRMPVGT